VADHPAAELRARDRRFTEPVASRIVLAVISRSPTAIAPAPGERRLPLDHLDLVLLEQTGDAAGERRDHLLAPGADPGVVDLRAPTR